MSLLRRVLWWLRGRFDGHGVAWSVDEDIRTHIQLDAERLRAEGLSASEALVEARRRFGDEGRIRSELLRIASTSRAYRRGASLGGSWTHLRHGLRSLLSTPWATLLVTATLAAGTGAATLMGTLGRTVLLGAGGVENPRGVVSIYGYYPTLPEGLHEQPLHGRMIPLIEATDGIQSVAGFKAGYFNLTGHGEPQRLEGLLSTPRLFDVSGVHPLFGPGFDESTTGEERLVVVSWRLWRDALGADPSAVGSTLVLNDEPYEIAGVMPAGFEFPRGADVPPTFRFPARPDVWVPYLPPEAGPSDLGIVARLNPGMTVSALRPRLDQVVAELERTLGRGMGMSFHAVELRDQAAGRVRPALLLLALATALVVGVAMANVTGVGVARSERRLRELAVRSALGAGRRGVAAFLAAESVVLGAVAAVGGLAIAAAMASLLRSAAPEGMPGVDLIRLGPGEVVFAFALAMTGASCLALGPLARMRKWNPLDALRGVRSGGGPGARRTGGVIIALELAATLVLLSGALLLAATVRNLLTVDTGFDASGVLTAEITLPEGSYPELARANEVQSAGSPGPAAVPRFQRGLIQRLEAQPEIRSAAFVNPLPFGGGQEASVYWVDGMDPTTEPPFSEYTVITEGYFTTMGIPVLEGREFDSSEGAESEPVAIVSRSLAAMFPQGEALGARIKLGGAPGSPYPWLRVVGVVGDVKRTDLVGTGRPELYVHISQGGYSPQSTSRLVVRSAGEGEPLATLDVVRGVLGELDPELPLNDVTPMTTLLAAAAGHSSFTAALTAGFSALGLLITALGLYSVVSFSATSRKKELAVRAAVGANGLQIATAVLTETAGALALGVALGLGGTVATAKTLDGLVFGVRPLDPTFLAAAASLLCLIAVTAAQGPVRACLRMDPARVLARE